jgi:ankyrin repeat protein
VSTLVAVKVKDDKGRTPLDWAGSSGEMSQMIKLLRSNGGKGTGAR